MKFVDGIFASNHFWLLISVRYSILSIQSDGIFRDVQQICNPLLKFEAKSVQIVQKDTIQLSGIYSAKSPREASRVSVSQQSNLHAYAMMC